MEDQDPEEEEKMQGKEGEEKAEGAGNMKDYVGGTRKTRRARGTSSLSERP